MTNASNPGIDALSQFASQTIQAAGQEGLAYYGKGQTDTKFDAALITEAEIRLTSFFREQLNIQFPGHQVFKRGQMADRYSHDGKRFVWIFDPIDGVDNFQAGVPIWGMSLAVLDNFWPILGFFYMPATGDLFQAQVNRGAYRGSNPINVAQRARADAESVLLTYSRFHLHYRSNFPGKIRNLGCTAAHMCYVAMGKADAAIIANESYQDLASTRVIVEAAGGKIFNQDGTVFAIEDYQDGQRIADHLIVTAPGNFGLVRESLQKRGSV